jgi:hypothetical protein
MENRSSYRAFARFDPKDKCKARFLHADELIIKNLSLGGLEIETEKSLKVNNKYVIHIFSSDKQESIKPTCVVSRSFLRSPENRQPVYEVALKFLKLDENEKQFLIKILKELS